jgi:hypothetical protein
MASAVARAYSGGVWGLGPSGVQFAIYCHLGGPWPLWPPPPPKSAYAVFLKTKSLHAPNNLEQQFYDKIKCLRTDVANVVCGSCSAVVVVKLVADCQRHHNARLIALEVIRLGITPY